MYTIKVEAGFSAAHNLREYKGKCEDLHGHNWKIEVVAARAELDKTGMLLDFHFLKSKLSEVIADLDHKYLNEIACFHQVNPTSENIAKYIYDQLKPKVLELRSVTVWENSTCSATYGE